MATLAFFVLSYFFVQHIVFASYANDYLPSINNDLSSSVLNDDLTSISNSVNDIITLNKKFEKYFARTRTITLEEWSAALPNLTEINDMIYLIQKLFTFNTFANLNTDILLASVPTLSASINITVIHNKYCVIHEKLPIQNNNEVKLKFRRFWGYTVISSREWTKRLNLHHSAAHFETDGEVCAQAAALFQKTRSRSLVVAGASRFAVCGNVNNTCQPRTSLADAAHNNATMFQVMNLGIWKASKFDNAIYPISKNFYIQWHGMANTTCPFSDVYVSVGAQSNHSIYKDPTAAVNRLVSAVNYEASHKIANTPKLDTKCILKAMTNVFGRILNGVSVEDTCWKNAKQNCIFGDFIHVEQKSNYRNNWNLWTRAVTKAFPPI